MKIRVVLVSLLALATVAGLAAFSPADPQTTNTQATNTQPTNTQATNTQATETYKVDPVHSTIVFRIKHLGVSYFYGRLNGPYGEFSFNPENSAQCAFDVKVRAKNVDTHNPRRDGHLKSADFFNAKQFPNVRFKSKQVTKTGDDTYRVIGDLTLHGVTREFTVELKHIGSGPDPWGGHRRGFETSFTIKRSDFGMKFMLDGVGDEVTLMIGIEGTRE